MSTHNCPRYIKQASGPDIWDGRIACGTCEAQAEANAMRLETGERVYDVEFENDGDGSAYVVGGVVNRADRWVNISEAEMDYLTETYPEKCDEYAFEAAIGAAEAFYEGDR